MVTKAYFRCATSDDDGYLNLRFSGWPEKVKEVDILRGLMHHEGMKLPKRLSCAKSKSYGFIRLKMKNTTNHVIRLSNHWL